MNTVTSLSGGETSSFMTIHYPTDVNVFAVVCIDCPEHKTDPAIIRYAQDKFQKYCPIYPDFQATAEDDQTLVAMMELEQFIGKEIVWVRGKLFDDILRTKSLFGGTPTRLPSWARRYCTSEGKMVPIFEFLFFNGFLPCHMNIGFRYDETVEFTGILKRDRIYKMYHDKKGEPKNPHFFKYPLTCNYPFNPRANHNWSEIYWRRAHFPLVRDKVIKPTIKAYWKGRILFPDISNCEGCFHKDMEVIAYKCNTSPAKMRWWMRAENLGKGTWRDDKITYEAISKSKLGKQLILSDFSACDSEGCTA